jgi:DNA-binding MarR family transcriptional regulator
MQSLAIATFVSSNRYAGDMTGSTRTSAPAVRWLDPDEMSAWRNYVDCIGALNQVLEADLTSFGLTMGDYEVLVRLSEAPDHRLRMCDLAGQLRLSPSGLTRRLDGLVKNGVVDRKPSEDDRRVMLAVLTEQGYGLLEQAAPHHVGGVRQHFIDRLTPAEVRALGSAFAKVGAALVARQTAAS